MGLFDRLQLTLAAPVIEDFLKSLILVYHVRQTHFTSFGDSAIYGFTAQSGFAFPKTLFYLSTRGGDQVPKAIVVADALIL